MSGIKQTAEIKWLFSPFIDQSLGPINSPKLKEIQFTIIKDEEKHHILIFEKLEPIQFWTFLLLKNYLNDKSIITIVAE